MKQTNTNKKRISKKEILRMYQELYNLGTPRMDAIDMLPLDDLKVGEKAIFIEIAIEVNNKHRDYWHAFVKPGANAGEMLQAYQGALKLPSIEQIKAQARREAFANNEDEDFGKSNKTLPVPKGFTIQKGEKYFWFPVIGESMTDGTNRSILDKSLVLCREIKGKSILDIPLDRPLAIFALSHKGETYSICKTVCFIDAVYDRIMLRSYNPSSSFNDRWLAVDYIKRVFVIEVVQRPDGSQFVPEIRKCDRPGNSPISALIGDYFSEMGGAEIRKCH